MNASTVLRARLLGFGFLSCLCVEVWAFRVPTGPELPNFDRRPDAAEAALTGSRGAAMATLRARVPDARVDFDAHTGAPKWVVAELGFLTGPNGEGRGVGPAAARAFGAGEEHRAAKAFLNEHQGLFGFGPEALAKARVKQDSVMAHNGLRTVVWEQELDRIPIFQALFIAHTTRSNELVNLSSHFVPDPERAAARGTPQRAAHIKQPPVAARRAVALAAQNLGEALDEADVNATGTAPEGPELRQTFRGPPLNGEAVTKLVWLPFGQDSLRLCWHVELTSRARGEMYRLLIDAQTGEVLVRHRLTEYLSDASYRVYTSDSPSPYSPGCTVSTCTTQPPIVARTLVTWSALDTNASPAGWIDDGGNETRGNNVDAHTDRDANDIADLPRPQGSPFRTFDFTMDLAQAPSTYTNAAVTDLFYWCNWMHDQLYALGFTEAARNFQSNNFGRGGLGNDALQADAQDGSGFNNANMSTPSDGSPPRMQMYVFNGPAPDRDGDLDHEIVLHEYTHGLSNRRVGGGVGLSALQSRGMGEGWSDWYGLALLSEPGDDVNGVYAAGGYATYQLSGLTANYYYGIRRYPYSTDLTKNPLTFKDIDPAQASPHTGVPRSPIIGNTADEVHNMGEVWCMTLWEARANLIAKYGFAIGNPLSLQLVTDGMNLSPANPNFLQARNAILQADIVANGGADLPVLWAAFAKRGMGYSATSPSSSTTVGLVEAYDVPDNLSILPMSLAASGPVGGPFTPNPVSFVVTNLGSSNINWSVNYSSTWINVAPTSGSLSPGGPSTTVQVTFGPTAATLPLGTHIATLSFSNQNTTAVQARPVTLGVVGRTMSDDFDPGLDLSQWSTFGGTVGSTVAANNYGGYVSAPNSLWFGDAGTRHATTIAVDTSGGGTIGFSIRLANGSAYPWEQADSLPTEGVVLEASTNNGTTWNLLGSYDTTAYYNWTSVTSAIPVSARSAATLFRWRQKSHSGSSFDHWAIDSVSIDATPATTLSLSLPAVAAEGDPPVSATLTAAPAPTNDLVVTLASSDTSEATVPPTVTILAGQSNAVFDITIENDTDLDGNQTAQITASAAGYGSTLAGLTVQDNETATLTVTVPAAATEGAGTIPGGLVTVDTAPTANIPVGLSSGDTSEAQVPASVLLLAGQTSVAFNVTIVNDTEIDGPQVATITAHVANWTDGTGNITVQDNEPTNLVVTLPVSAREGNGTLSGAGSVRISGSLTTNLTVALSSSDLTELTVPPTATIFAGATMATFYLTIEDDPNIDSSQTVTVTASADGFANGAANMVVTDDESPPEPFNPSPAHLATNVIQTADLAWLSGAQTGEVITNDVYFGTNPTPGPAELLGSTTGTNWTLPTLFPATTYYWQIVARKTGVTPGPVWQFTTRGVDHFVWEPIPGTQYVSQPFPVTVTAKDVFETTVSNFTGTVALSALGGTTAAALFADGFEDGNFSDWSVGLGTYTRSVTSTTAAEGTYSFTQIGGANNHYDGISHSLANLKPARIVFYVRAASTNVTCGYFVIGNAQTTSGTAIWFYMRYDGMGIYEDTSGAHLVPYQANQWYKISFLLNWTTYRLDYYVNDVLAYANLPFRGNVANLTMVHLYNFDNTQAWWDGIELSGGNVSAALSLSPTNSAGFVDGAWSGNVAVLEPTTNVTLKASDNASHTGLSNPFEVRLQNDLAVTVTDAPDPVSLGGNLTYTINVTNLGPAAATGVLVTNVLASGVSLVSVNPSQGTVSTNGNVVLCDLGALAGDTAATIAIVATATNAGTLTNRTFLARGEPDAYLPNNSATVTTSVQTPVITISDVSVYESGLDLIAANFTVSIVPAPAFAASVNFTTVPGTAVSPGDFLATNGVVNFAPGETNQTISVQVVADALYELNENFSVSLSGAVNATLGDNQALGTILNDDPMPTLSIGDATLKEGNTGSTNAVFTVTLSNPSGLPTTAYYATASGNATAGSDYTAISGYFSLPAGSTSTNLTVPVNGDLQIETDEVFYLDLSSVANAILLKREGVGWIVNDDGLPGELDHFVWDAIPSPQWVGEPFGVTLTALDAFNQPATNFSGPANLVASLGPAGTNVVGTGTGSYTFPIYTAYDDERTQVIYPASELGGAGRIMAVALDVATAPSLVLNNWTIRMKHTPLTSYSSYLWETSNWTVVYQGNLTIPMTGWLVFPLTTPFDYNGSNSLMIDFSFNNSTYGGVGYARGTSQSATRTLYYYAYSSSGYGDPLNWSGSVPAPNAIAATPNLQLIRGGATVPLLPSVTGPFSNAVWSGALTALAPASNLVVRADDGAGHQNYSATFNVGLRNDIALQMSGPAGPVPVLGNVTYALTVTNVGPSVATGVTVTNLLPAGAALVSVTPSQGGTLTNGNEVVCELGTLAANTAATVGITVQPSLPGNMTNAATVSRDEADPLALNNSAQIVTLVQLPVLAINNVSVVEGNSGATQAVFTVTASPPPATNVWVNFTTANGTAQAGSDYVATNGLLVFTAGQSNLLLAVAVLGDTNAEPGETFSVVLSGATNATLGVAVGTGLIINDEVYGRVGIFGAPGTDSWNTDVQQKVAAAGSFAQVDAVLIKSGQPTPTLAQLQQYAAVMVYSDATFTDGTALGNVLADYVDTGGGVVVCTFAFGGNLQGRLVTGGYLPFNVASQDQPGNLTLVADLPAHDILNGVGSFNGGTASYHNTGTLTPGAVQVAHWSNNRPLVGTKETNGHRVVGLNFYPPSSTVRSDFWNTNTQGGLLMANALNWAANSGPNTNPPAIVTQPASQTVVTGNAASFSVLASGAAPLSYQWRKDGGDLAGATASNFNLAAAQTNDAGSYAVVITNLYGSITSAPAVLTVVSLPPNADFVIVSLLTNNSYVVDHNAQTGDDRGGIAASDSILLYSGDASTARFNLANLSGITALGSVYDAIVSDLRSGKIYSLANGTTPLSYSGGTVTTLLEHNPTTGVPTTTTVTLTSPISLPANSGNVGIFAGYGRVVVHTGSRVFDIAVPSGIVTDLGAMTWPAHAYTENWAYWGVAEYSGGQVRLVYVRDTQTIVRTVVPGGPTTEFAYFSNLSDMACITVSVPLNRWYFHHEGGSQFGGSSETVGYADAVFSITAPTNPPSITMHPTNRLVSLGGTATFYVAATGPAPLGYQWRKDGAPLAGATGTSCTLAGVQWADAGGYSAVVTNPFGAVTSAVAVLTVTTNLPVVINFDDFTAPCNFADTKRLTNRYAALGAMFAGPGGLDGGAVVDQCGSFGVGGYSPPNFLAFNTGAGLNGGGVPRGPETLLFSNVVQNFQMKIGGGSGGTATLLAYDTNNTLLTSSSLTLSSTMQTMQAATSGIARVVISATGSVWVMDDVSFLPQPIVLPPPPPLEFKSIVRHEAGLRLVIGHADGSAISPARASNIWVYATTDLAVPLSNWTAIATAPVLSNGVLVVDGLNGTNPPVQFFRAIEGSWNVTPLRLEYVPQPNGQLLLRAGSADGSPVTPARAARISFYTATKAYLPLPWWTPLTVTTQLSNGVVTATSPPLTNAAVRFFRAVEAR